MHIQHVLEILCTDCFILYICPHVLKSQKVNLDSMLQFRWKYDTNKDLQGSQL